MIMVGWLMMRHPILFKKMCVAFLYYHCKGREAHLLLKSWGWCEKYKNANESYAFIPISSHQRELSIEIVKDKLAWY